MHGADKPVVGDLVFEESSTVKVEAGEEDAEVALEAAEGEVTLDDKTANEDAGMGQRHCHHEHHSLFMSQLRTREDLARDRGRLGKHPRSRL